VAQIVADMTPLRDVFNSLFFVSIGMLIDLDVWLARPWLVAGLVAAAIIGKALIAAIAVLPAVRSLSTAVASGMALAQIGELAVVVAVEANRLGLGSETASAMFLAVTVPTMIATPFVLRAAGPLARWIEVRRPGPIPAIEGDDERALDDHVVVVGFGVNGRNVTRALAALEVPHVVVDLNAPAIREVTDGGGRGVYGDATRDAVLKAACVGRARAVIAAVPDAAATRQVVSAARRLAPEVTILARTRYVREVEPLEKLGADQVIPEEFETSIELTARVLRLYGASEAMVHRERQALRAAHYGALRGAGPDEDVPTLEALRAAADIARIEVRGGCRADRCSLRSLGVREHTGATVVALDRDGVVQPNPSPDLRLRAGDVLVVYGTGDQFAAVRELASAPAADETSGDPMP
jgi:CPA2 family monovalent cation:H+ antiporter-2